jgi:hypothetical protein
VVAQQLRERPAILDLEPMLGAVDLEPDGGARNRRRDGRGGRLRGRRQRGGGDARRGLDGEFPARDPGQRVPRRPF